MKSVVKLKVKKFLQLNTQVKQFLIFLPFLLTTTEIIMLNLGICVIFFFLTHSHFIFFFLEINLQPGVQLKWVTFQHKSRGFFNPCEVQFKLTSINMQITSTIV